MTDLLTENLNPDRQRLKFMLSVGSKTDLRPLLFQIGVVHITRWCQLNDVDMPRIVESEEPKKFNTCAYYRDSTIVIRVDGCAKLGFAGRAWSWPGNIVDRTPYGVLAHELGHHVDRAHGTRGGVISRTMRRSEEPITSYSPNVQEWFAEMFRLFVTNPDLLMMIRPMTYRDFIERWPNKAEKRAWREVLFEANRQISAAEKKIRKVGHLFV